MSKTATIRTRIEPSLKSEVEDILAQLGLTASETVQLLYRQIKLQRGLPFDVRMPNALTARTLRAEQGGQEREALWQQEGTLCQPASLIYTLTEKGSHVCFERTGRNSDLFRLVRSRHHRPIKPRVGIGHSEINELRRAVSVQQQRRRRPIHQIRRALDEISEIGCRRQLHQRRAVRARNAERDGLRHAHKTRRHVRDRDAGRVCERIEPETQSVKAARHRAGQREAIRLQTRRRHALIHHAHLIRIPIHRQQTLRRVRVREAPRQTGRN